jgi:ABC-type sugar transport system ATPase subunit
LNTMGEPALMETTSRESSLVRYENVSMTYPSTRGRPPLRALEPVNLSVERGEFICLVGPSGCGKTTLL